MEVFCIPIRADITIPHDESKSLTHYFLCTLSSADYMAIQTKASELRRKNIWNKLVCSLHSWFFFEPKKLLRLYFPHDTIKIQSSMHWISWIVFALKRNTNQKKKKKYNNVTKIPISIGECLKLICSTWHGVKALRPWPAFVRQFKIQLCKLLAEKEPGFEIVFQLQINIGTFLSLYVLFLFFCFVFLPVESMLVFLFSSCSLGYLQIRTPTSGLRTWED